MNTEITIQTIDNSYSEQIINLILPIQQIEFNVPVTLDDQPDLLDIEINYHQTGGNFWGAMHKKELVGTIAMINTGHNVSALRKMFVKKEYRGKSFNIAQRLLETYIQFCKDNEVKDIYLGTVELLKAAHRFYEKNGFTKIDVTALPSYFPRMMADNRFYHLHI